MSPYFDTLKYAQMLKAAGVSQADTQARALSEALCESTFSKSEVEKMFAELLKQFEQSQAKSRAEQALIRTEFEKSQALMRAELAKDIQRASWTTIAAVSALVGLFGSVMTLSHFFH